MANKELDCMMSMAETITGLEKLFDKLNGIYFEGKLPRPVITIQSTPRAYGHCSTKQIWIPKTEEQTETPPAGMYEINLGAEYINRPLAETAATLIHEMVHLYCIINDITDTCQGGRYHNKTFKEEAEARDLHIEYDRTIGYSITSPTDALIKKLEECDSGVEIKLARILPKRSSAIGIAIGGPTEKPRNKSHKYVCLCCGQTVRSTSDFLNLICGNCHEPLIKLN